MYDESVFGILETQRARLENVRENSGRSARSSLTYTTTGVGEAFTGVYQDLQMTFLEEPTFTSGMVLDHTTPLVSGYFPQISCGVSSWNIDASGYYIGAYLFFAVSTTGSSLNALKTLAKEQGTAAAQPNYIIHHHLVFEGKAFKDLPSHLLDFTVGLMATQGRG